MAKKEMKRELLIEDVKGNRAFAYALLEAKHPLFIDEVLNVEGDNVILEGQITESMYGWKIVMTMPLEDKLRHLINIGEIYESLLHDKYTYQLGPEYLVFTMNGMPKLTHRGIKNQVAPFEYFKEESFLAIYQAMIVSLIDLKVDYDMLLNGKLPFYKGDLLCESIVKSRSIAEILSILQEKFREEKEINLEQYSRVKNSVLFKWKLSTMITAIIATIGLAVMSYLLIFAVPNQTMISEIRLAFIQQDYSKVISTVKDKNSKEMSQEDKYIVAYSVIMSEPLSTEQKKSLSKISTQSNEEYLRYWILIGQSKVDEAIDIASFLDDPQLLMYGMTKKIDEIQRDPNLKSEQRTEAINSYKTKLEELKKKYLTPQNDLSEKTNGN